MSRYRRAIIKGGTFFFTVTLAKRPSDLLILQIDLLRNAYDFTRSGIRSRPSQSAFCRITCMQFGNCRQEMQIFRSIGA
jgi:REP element-mobilizing transposase RayT